MSQRERLMDAAKRCLEERGYARTSSRDLAAAAEANLGSICYHYGSKDELLTAALMETVDAWGEKAVQISAETGGTPLGRLERMLAQVIEPDAADRAMMVAAVEALAQAERLPRVREQIADAYERSRPRLAADVHGIDAEADERTARAVGSIYMAMTAGLSLQRLIDPERAPTGDDVALGLRAILRVLHDSTEADDGERG